jgi:hypothetical protein
MTRAVRRRPGTDVEPLYGDQSVDDRDSCERADPTAPELPAELRVVERLRRDAKERAR